MTRPIDRQMPDIATKREAANAEGKCFQCLQPALLRCYSEAGRREYFISGICEVCFDHMMAEPPDETDSDL